jgi:hypothetical protein
MFSVFKNKYFLKNVVNMGNKLPDQLEELL